MSAFNNNCTPPELPKAEANYCDPVINYGQIQRIFVGTVGNPFTDVSDLTEWTNRLDNDTLADATKIRYFNVIGSKPKAEKEEIALSLGRKVYTEGNHNLPFRVDETNDTNYAFLKFLEENTGATFSLWFLTPSKLYGGKTGVEASLEMGLVIPENDNELEVYEGSASWEGNHPDRIDTPFG